MTPTQDDFLNLNANQASGLYEFTRFLKAQDRSNFIVVSDKTYTVPPNTIDGQRRSRVFKQNVKFKRPLLCDFETATDHPYYGSLYLFACTTGVSQSRSEVEWDFE